MARLSASSKSQSPKGTPILEKPADHWKAGKRALNIDFESLERLIVEYDIRDETESDYFNEDALKDKQRSSWSKIPDRSLSKLILHTSSTNSIFHANEFKDLNRAGQDLRDIFCQNEDEAWWLDMQNPSEHELRHICAAFNIHPLTVEDIWKREASEKIEEYPFYRFSSFRSFHEITEDDEIVYEPYTIYLVVFSQGTLSFCFDENEHSSNVEKRITRFEELASMKSDWIFYAFVDDIVDAFVPSIARVETIVESIEDEVYTTRKDDMKAFLFQIESIRRRVLSLIRLLDRKDNVLRGFENHHSTTMNSDKDILLYINDVQDHIAAMLSSLHHFEGLLSRSKSNYLAQLSAATLTEKIRVFTFLSRVSFFALILTLITLTSNLFGSNVAAESALFNGGTVGPFFTIVGVEVGVALTLFLLARRYERYW